MDTLDEDILLTDEVTDFDGEVSKLFPDPVYDVYVYPDTVIYKRTLKDRFFSWPWRPWISKVRLKHKLYQGEQTPYIYVEELSRFICTASAFDQLKKDLPSTKFNVVRMPEEEL